MSPRQGEAHHNVKMTEAQVRDLRLLVERGICQMCAAKVLGLSLHRGSIHDAVTYRTWKHVK